MAIAQLRVQFAAALGNLGGVLNAAQTGFNNVTQAAAQTSTAFNTAAQAAARMGQNVASRINTPVAAFSRLNKNVNSVISRFTLHNAVVNTSANAYKGLVGQVANLNRFFNATFAAIRQIGQGLQNFGTVFSIFISTPIALIIRNITAELINFDDQMIEVRKTTGATTELVKQLGDSLTDLSTRTPTAREELAKIAADWGRMGIEMNNATDIAAVTALVEVTDQLVISTDLAADKVVTGLGRIGNIYKVFEGQTDDFRQNITAIASVINELGQKNPEFESELLSAATRFAPTARSIGIPIEQMFGLTASVVGTSASPERAGTQLASALGMVTKNLDKFAASMGMTEAATKDWIDTDPTGFLVEVATRLGNVESATDRTRLAIDLFGRIGANAILSLAANVPYLTDNLELAAKSFEEATSIQEEFNRAMDSVKNQLGLLRNNLRYVGITITEAILPQITKLIALAVPALQILAEHFKSLDESTRLWIVGIALAATALGPFLIMLGTLMFSIGIIGTGLSTMAAVLINIASHIGRTVLGLVGLLRPFNLIAVAIGGIIIAAGYIVSTLEDTSNAFTTFISNAYNWGYNLFASFADGISSAAGLVYNTVLSVIREFIGLLEAFSPPREGPLSDIEDWGENTMESYADGMEKAKTTLFSVAQSSAFAVLEGLRGVIDNLSPESLDLFSSMFGGIRGVITDVVSFLDDSVKDLELDKWLETAATELARFLDAAESGGGSLSALSGVLGSLTGDYEQLVRYQYAYVASEERLDDIKNSLKGIDDETRRAIAGINARTDLTLDQRIALIRQIKYEAEERRRQLEAEKDVAEEDRETARDRLDAQRGKISALESLIRSDTSSKKKTDEIIPLDELDEEDSGLDKIKQNFEDAGDIATTFFDKIARGRQIIEGFFAGIRGDEFDDTMSAEWIMGYERGSNIRNILSDFFGELGGWVDWVQGKFETVSGWFDVLTAGIRDGFRDIFDEDMYDKLSTFEKVIYNIGIVLGQTVGSISEYVSAMSEFFRLIEERTGKGASSTILEGLGRIGEAFVKNIDPDNSLRDKLEFIDELLASITKSFVIAAGLTFTGLERVLTPLVGLVSYIAGLALDDITNWLLLIGGIQEFILAIAGFSTLENSIELIEQVFPAFSRLKPVLEDVILLTDELFKLGAALGMFAEQLGLNLFLIVEVVIATLTLMKDFIADTLGTQLLNIVIFLATHISTAFTWLARQLIQTITYLLTSVTRALAIIYAFTGSEKAKRRLELVTEMQNEQIDEMTGLLGVSMRGLRGGTRKAVELIEGPQDEDVTPTADENRYSRSLLKPDTWFANMDKRRMEDEAAALADGAGESYAMSFSDSLSDPANTLAARTSMTSFIQDTTESLKSEMETSGITLAEDLLAGYQEEIAISTAQAQDSWLQELSAWQARKKIDVEGVGSLLGGDISTGVISESTKSMNLNNILDGMESWADSPSSKSWLRFIGFDMGTLLVEGMARAIKDNEPYIWDAVWTALTGISGGTKTAKNPFKPPEQNVIGPSALDRDTDRKATLEDLGFVPELGGSEVNSSGVTNINLYVDKETISDRRNATSFANEVRRVINRDTRYFKLATG